MRRLALFRVRLFQIQIIILAVASISQVASASYVPGVKTGDYVKYAYITAGAGAPGSPLPQSIKDLMNTNYFSFQAQSVSANNVTLRITENFKNGTSDMSQVITFNVQTGKGNQSSVPMFSFAPLVVSGGLAAGSSIYDSTTSPKFNPSINVTFAYTYAGAPRDIDQIALNQTLGVGSYKQTILSWDKPTGAVVETYLGYVNSSTSPKTAYGFDFRATETSLWSPRTLGLPLILFYGVIGAVVAAVVIVAVLVLRRRIKIHPL